MANEEINNQVELNDVEIAELANNEIKQRDKEIADLKKQLAKAKLYQQVDDVVEEVPTKEDCLKVIADGRTTNYDYALAVCNLVDACRSEGEQNPLGDDGDEVYDFLRDVIDACDGDKKKFTSIYQAKIGPDDAKVAAAYNKRIKQFH